MGGSGAGGGARGQMRKMTAEDAENRAREFIWNRHQRIRLIRFARTRREDDVWLVEGELWLGRALFFRDRRPLKLRISTETGEVVANDATYRTESDCREA